MDRSPQENRKIRVHGALPVRRRFPLRLPPRAVDRIRAHAGYLRTADELLRPDAPHPGICPGLQDGAALLIHDISQTRVPAPRGPSPLEYRALLLASDDDLVAIAAHRSPAFEEYIQELLGVAGVQVHRVEQASAGNLADAALEDEELLEQCVERARSTGGLSVRPYQASRSIWRLADEIGRRADVRVTVEGPPPALAERVNDKVWFTEQVRAVLGSGAVPPSVPAADLEELIERIRDLGSEHDEVAVRLRSGAGGEGNLVIPMSAIAGSTPAALQAMLRHLFGILEWEDVFPLQVAVWEAPVIASPSVQLWIPLRGDGPPIVEGVFEQRVNEATGEFEGVTTTSLPDGLQDEIATGAGALATLFQELGYFGRCSFDTILVGPDLDSAVLHWVECNGRWGGASIPMTAAERITGDWTQRPFAVLSLRHEQGPRVSTEQVLELLDEVLLSPNGQEGVFPTSPTALETGMGLDLMAIAGTRKRAEDLLRSARQRIHGVE